jgi:hypothetical protein
MMPPLLPLGHLWDVCLWEKGVWQRMNLILSTMCG